MPLHRLHVLRGRTAVGVFPDLTPSLIAVLPVTVKCKSALSFLQKAWRRRDLPIQIAELLEQVVLQVVKHLRYRAVRELAHKLAALREPGLKFQLGWWLRH